MTARGGGQRLSPIDGTMRCVDVATRQLGYPGIETQMLVWLAGRADVELLRAAIARLSRSYPVIASRLVEFVDGQGYPASWQFREGAVCLLHEVTLPSNDPEAVLAEAGRILSDGDDPAVADPLEFHLLHRPDGRDVLLLQYNHALMDNTASVPLLRELARLCHRDSEASVPVSRPRRILEHLRQFSKPRRRQAVQAAIELQAHALRGRAVALRPRGPDPVGQAPLRMATRTLEKDATNDFRSEVLRICGFPCLSMAVLGSAFRAVEHLKSADQEPGDFAANIGVPLSPTNPETFLPQNWMSAVPIRVGRPELANRDQLIRLLWAQFRQRLDEGVDLGVLETMAIFGRRFRYIEWVIWHLVHYGHSLWYGYFGDLDAAGSQLAGVRIEDLFYTGGPLWPAIGLSLLVNQYRGRLHFQATYDPRLISPSLAEAFLDDLLADLPQSELSS